MRRKITPADLQRALTRCGTLKYWPLNHPEIIAENGVFLAKICPHAEALEYVIDQLVDHVGEWPGPKEVRGILCNRYDAADGIDSWCTLPGLDGTANETKAIAAHAAVKCQLSPSQSSLVRELARMNEWFDE